MAKAPISQAESIAPTTPVFCTLRPGGITNDHYVCTVDFSISTFKRKVIFLVPEYYKGKNKTVHESQVFQGECAGVLFVEDKITLCI